jgi:hypothetical protein
MLGIDATGYSTEYHSHYYDKRVREFGMRRKRRYMKSTITVALGTQMIISYKIGLNFRNDTMDFPAVLKKIPESIIGKFTHIIGDKGYDSEKNHQIARSYGLISVIPARNEDVPVYRTRGYYSKRMKRKSRDEYRERAKVEKVHSVIKRRFGNF